MRFALHGGFFLGSRGFLPTDYRAFDLVVFDEASQITVWDSVGAIARAKNAIVVGDPKQMPPTNFFSRAHEDSDSDEADLESILDQAMAARVGYHRLTGHYRSRHESLITFSNHQYYQNSLITYPCADTKESAVTLRRVDGIYARGKSRNNPIEAQAVVAEVMRRLSDPELQKLSIGIVTFNSEQQQLIENLLDDERRKDSKIERFFQEDHPEPVFVKNLETVQGDQRDVICLSIGYGPTEPGAQTMGMNFGPLNKQGGERRLNVAVTRASTEMVLFSSFDASMIDLSRTKSEAVKDLKAYIDYADRGPAALARQIGFTGGPDKFDSEFEEAVASELRQKGWQIKTQIGVSKFRIDLGVINPDVGGAFLAGVECDGASYHSSPSARDRDRVRHIILENLGWKLIRIWSTDFFVNPKRVIDRVDRQLREILQKSRDEIEEKRQREIEEKEQEQNAFEGDAFLEPAEETVSEEGLSGDYAVSDEEQKLDAEARISASIYDEAERRPDQYLHFSETTIDPAKTYFPTIAEGLSKIIEVEGPIIAKRAFDVYLRSCGIQRMGNKLSTRMLKALSYGLEKGWFVKVEKGSEDDNFQMLLAFPGRTDPKLRTLGKRNLHEVPLSELELVSRYVIEQYNRSGISLGFGDEDHMREILEFYGLKRLTDQTRERLLKAIFLAG